MTITRAAADTELVDRCGGLLGFVGRSAVTDGTNPVCVGPLREGLSSLGIAVASFGAVIDADLAAVTTLDQQAQLFDIAELRLLRNIMGWLVKVDQKLSLGAQSLGQVRTDLAATIKDLAARCQSLYGFGASTISVGDIDLGFAETRHDLEHGW